MVNFCKRHALLLFSLATSLLVLGICSKNSPLYPMNDWVDVHCFFTMGRSMLDGLVLYRDLYEQKGPVLYFIYALVSLFSGTSFLGVFLLEVASFTAFLYFAGKTVMLYHKSILFACLCVSVIAVTVGTCPALAHGGSVEEMCLGLMTYGIYSLFSCFLEKRCLTWGEALVNGLFAGMILWIKFTMLGFYVGLCLTVLVYYCIYIRDFKKLLSAIGVFLGGVGIVTAVVAMYFLCTGATEELLTAYFYNNLFLYPSDAEVSKLQQIRYCLKWALYYNGNFAWALYLGGIWLVLLCWKQPMQLLCGVSCFAGLVTLTYWGGKGIMQGYGYYDLVLAVFLVFGLCAVGWALSLIPRLLHSQWLKLLLPSALAALLVLSAFFSLQYGRNTYLMAYEKDDMPQYKFAQIINREDSPTLLNYGFLDGGFYYAADVVPNCRFFCNFNVAAPDMWETQWEMLWAGKFDFVVTRSYPLPGTFTKYQLVSTADMMFENIDFTYYLYKLKDTIE